MVLQEAVVAVVSATKMAPGDKKDDAEVDALTKLKTALNGVKKDNSILEGFPAADMLAVLQCVQRRWMKKLFAGRAREFLGILFISPSWLRAAQGDQALATAFTELFATEEVMLQRLTNPALEEAPKKAEGADELAVRRQAIEQAQSWRDKMEKELRGGMALMREFEFTFPNDTLGVKMDRATEAFTMFYDGMVKLDGLLSKASPEDRIAAILESFSSSDVEGLMHFLSTMYHCGSRSSQHLRIKFVSEKMLMLCPSFQAAATQKGWKLPDAYVPPMPPPAHPDSLPDLLVEPSVHAVMAEVSPGPKPVQPVIVWVDYNAKAYSRSTLHSDTSLTLIGMQDSPEKPAVWDQILGSIGDIIADPHFRLDVVICNRKHVPCLKEIALACDAEAKPAPMFIISTRDASEVPPTPPGIKLTYVTDWRVVETTARNEVSARQGKAGS